MKARSTNHRREDYINERYPRYCFNHSKQFGNSVNGRPFDETHIQPQKAACAGSDVVLTTGVQTIFPFDIECKKGNSTTLEQAFIQSRRRVPIGSRTLVIMSHDRKPSVAFGLISELTEYENFTMGDDRLRTLFVFQPENDEIPDDLYTEWYEDVHKNKSIWSRICRRIRSLLSLKHTSDIGLNDPFIQMDFKRLVGSLGPTPRTIRILAYRSILTANWYLRRRLARRLIVYLIDRHKPGTCLE